MKCAKADTVSIISVLSRNSEEHILVAYFNIHRCGPRFKIIGVMILVCVL